MADKITNEKFNIEDIRNAFSISESRRTIPSLTNEMVFRNPQTQGKPTFDITAPITGSDAVLKPVISPILQTTLNKPFEIKPTSNNNMADTSLKAATPTTVVAVPTTPIVTQTVAPNTPTTVKPTEVSPTPAAPVVAAPTVGANVRVNLSSTGLETASRAEASGAQSVTFQMSAPVQNPSNKNEYKIDLSNQVPNLDSSKVMSKKDFETMIKASGIEFKAKGLSVQSASILWEGNKPSLVVQTKPVTGIAVGLNGTAKLDENQTLVPGKKPVFTAAAGITFGGPNNDGVTGNASGAVDYTNGQLTANGTITAKTDTATDANQSFGTGNITIPAQYLSQAVKADNGLSTTPAVSNQNQIKR
jgi:hypothetical protein